MLSFYDSQGVETRTLIVERQSWTSAKWKIWKWSKIDEQRTKNIIPASLIEHGKTGKEEKTAEDRKLETVERALEAQEDASFHPLIYIILNWPPM
jgi:hypothetical protein